MTLIIILVALGLDFFLGGLERLRDFSWLRSYYYYSEKRVAHHAQWNGPLGVIGLLFIPMLLFVLLLLFLDGWHSLFEGLFTLAVLVYCLAPEKLDNQLDYLVVAYEDDKHEQQQHLTEQIINRVVIDDSDRDELAVMKSALVESLCRTFAVIFWFLVLGVAGAFLYRIVMELRKELLEIESGFSNSLRDLQDILEWPVSRLMVLGMALAAHMMDALDGWRKHEALSISVNQAVLIAGGVGALQYSPEKNDDEGSAYWIDELKGLLNRTLIIWLAVIAIMTLSGKLG